MGQISIMPIIRLVVVGTVLLSEWILSENDVVGSEAEGFGGLPPLTSPTLLLATVMYVGSISIPRGKCGMEFLSSTTRGIWNIPLELESNWREPITHLYVGIVQLFT